LFRFIKDTVGIERGAQCSTFADLNGHGDSLKDIGHLVSRKMGYSFRKVK
ncbi:jg3531, partial [Pararge aegeria aegeria]